MPCFDPSKRIIRDFTMIPHDGSAGPPVGKLEIDPETIDGTFSGRHYVGTVAKERFSDGRCKSFPLPLTDICFTLRIDTAVYFFAGTMEPQKVHGSYIVYKTDANLTPSKDSSEPQALTPPDEGDTGTWGGNQT